MPFDIAENIRHYGFKRLLLAVSGGLDSICLAHYFIENREALGIEWLGIAHVHHGLREGTADRDAKFVEEFAKSHDVPFFLKRLDGEALKTAEGSLEENAREARYKALIDVTLEALRVDRVHENEFMDPIGALPLQDDRGRFPLEGGHDSAHSPYPKAAEGCDPIPHTPIAIVTAHHAGDQAETMLMRLKRGTTLAGLRGIQALRQAQGPYRLENLSNFAQNDESLISYTPYPKATEGCDPIPHTPYLVFLYRPFLNVTRAELLDYARKNKLNWCEDESNADVKFARNKIRHEILPQLEHECPGATQQLCKIARLADKAYAKMMEKCSKIFAPCLLNGESLDPSALPQDDVLQGSSTPLRFAQDDTKSTPSPMVRQKVTELACRACRSTAEVHQPILRLATDPIPHSSLALDKKKLNKILRTYADVDLSELFRLWLSELGFRFPTGFFYAPKEPAHVKIPVRAVYRKRSIVKIRHTVWICEFGDSLTASKFVSCEMKEKDYNEPAQKANFPI